MRVKGNKVGQRQLYVRIYSPDRKGRMLGVMEAVQDVVQNFDRSVRDGVRIRFAATVIANAEHNIEAGKKRSQYPNPLDYQHSQFPPADRLSRSIRIIEGRGDVVEIAHSDPRIAPYGMMHDKPIGSSTAIYAKDAPRLRFPNRKNILEKKVDRVGKTGRLRVRMRKKPAKWLYRKQVQKPGTAFFSRAVKDAARDIPSMIQKEIEIASPVYEGTQFKVSSKGGKIYRGGAKAAARKLRNRRGG